MSEVLQGKNDWLWETENDLKLTQISDLGVWKHNIF